MEKKHLWIAVTAILLTAVVVGLLLPVIFGEEAPPVETQPSETTLQTTAPQETTVTVETTAETTEATTAPTEAPTQPTEAPTAPTTAPTEPAHVHGYQKKETVAPALDNPGYSLYVCGCGHSYRGDVTAALTLQQVINAQSLNPTATGIEELDKQVQTVLAQILPANATNYEKLDAIYDYMQTGFTRGGSEVDLGQAAKLAGDKVFRHVGELLFAYEANQMLTQHKGVSDHYAALFCVLTRAAGFDSYVVNGSRDGKNHVWNNVRIDGKLYAFDTYEPTAPQFAVADDELTGYTYSNRDKALQAQSGFQLADTFIVKLTYTDDNGTAEKTFTWSTADMRSGTANFMKNTPALTRCNGTVTYTLEVISGSGSFRLVNEKGEEGITLTGTLEPGAGYYTLQAEEENSMRHFDIRIDN